MLEMAQSAALALGGFLMIIATVLAISPILPGALLVWGVAIITAVITGFERITPLASILITAVMLVGITSDFWLPILGVKTSGLTCLSAIGSFVGGLIGTFVIPIPIAGTLIGSILGALAAELIAFRGVHRAYRAGKTAVKLWVAGTVVELATCVAMLIIYLVSVGATA
ncbi:DUF456 domain-containing protein [Anaerolineae bacterium CFX9]|nr:DUF456 domain-containing protein [Anaerolineae bacterium CFX9]